MCFLPVFKYPKYLFAFPVSCLCVCLELCLGFLISRALVCGCFSRWMPACTQGVSGKVILHLCVSLLCIYLYVPLQICVIVQGRVWLHARGLEWVEQAGCAWRYLAHAVPGQAKNSRFTFARRNQSPALGVHSTRIYSPGPGWSAMVRCFPYSPSLL